MYLLGTEMDFQTDKLASQFVFNNPNQTGVVRLRRERQPGSRCRRAAPRQPRLIPA